MTQNRMVLLKTMLRAEGNFHTLVQELQQYDWDFDGTPAVLDKRALKNVLSRYLMGQLTYDDVHFWADFFELREDVDTPAEEESVVSEILHELANPDLLGVLTPRRAEMLVSLL